MMPSFQHSLPHGLPIYGDEAGRLFVGDPKTAPWKLLVSSPIPGVPPNEVYLPVWTWDETDQGEATREILRTIFQLEFLTEACGSCGRQHLLIAYGPDRVEVESCSGGGP